MEPLKHHSGHTNIRSRYKLVHRTRESVGAAKQFCSKMVRNRQSKTLLHFVERLIFSQWILNLVVTGFEPTTIRFADGSINRHAIRPVGPQQKPFSSTSEEDPKIAKRTSLNRQFLGQVAGGRVGSGRAGSPIVFFYKDQTSEPLRGKKLVLASESFLQ